MTAVPKRKLTAAEYLEIERKAEFKSEFYRGEMFAMAGASYAHNRVKDNIAFRLNAAFVGGPCFASTSDMRVKVDATGLYTYPDVVVVCGTPEFEDDVVDTLLNPQVIFEVLSDSTENYDRGTKLRNYQRIPSLREYVLVAQHEPAYEIYVRQANGKWSYELVAGRDRELVVESVSVRVKLADVYAGVTFPESTASDL